MSPSLERNKWVVDGILIDVGFNVLSSGGLFLLPATRSLNMYFTKLLSKKISKRMDGMGNPTSTMGALKFYFPFVDVEYSADLKMVPGNTPLFIPHKNLENMSPKYQTSYKIFEELDDGYTETVQKRPHIYFLLFSKFSLLNTF